MSYIKPKNITVGTISTDSTHTGDANETVVGVIEIPANTFRAGDTFEFFLQTYKDSGSETLDTRIYINTSGDLTGSPQQIAYYGGSTNRAWKILRGFFVKSEATYNLRGVLDGTVSRSQDFAAFNYTTAQRGWTVDFTVTQYLVISVQLSVGAVNATLEGAVLKRFRPN